MRQLFEIEYLFHDILSDGIMSGFCICCSELSDSFFPLPRDMIQSPVYLAVPLPGRIHKAVTGVWVMFSLFTLYWSISLCTWNIKLFLLSCLCFCLVLGFFEMNLTSRSAGDELDNLKLRVLDLHCPIVWRLSKWDFEKFSCFWEIHTWIYYPNEVRNYRHLVRIECSTRSQV